MVDFASDIASDVDGDIMRKIIIKHRRKSEPILLRDILPKVMSDIRLRMAVQKAIKSRAITGSDASRESPAAAHRGNHRPGKVWQGIPGKKLVKRVMPVYCIAFPGNSWSVQRPKGLSAGGMVWQKRDRPLKSILERFRFWAKGQKTSQKRRLAKLS